MSRGLGAVQRLVLDVLAERDEEQSEYRWAGVFEIAHRQVCGGELQWEGDWPYETWECDACAPGRPTAATQESIRRAIRTLEKAGLVETKRENEMAPPLVWRRRWTRYVPRTTFRKQLSARLPLSVEEAEAERDRQRLLMEQLRRDFGLADASAAHVLDDGGEKA